MLDRIIKVKQTTGETCTIGGQIMPNDTWYDILDDAGRIALFNDRKVKEYIFSSPQKVHISNGIVELMGQAAYDWISANEKKDIDGRDIVHDTPRYLGTYTCFTGTDDDHSDPHAVWGDEGDVCELIWDHTLGSDLTKTIYMDFNTINNETYVRQGDIQWETAKNDIVSFTLVPRTTSYTVESNTSYDLYGGYLITPNPYGTGTINVSTGSMQLVQNTPNEFGTMPAGYWDAEWDTDNKEFTNVQPNYY